MFGWFGFIRAGQRMREGTAESLADAIKLLDRSLSLDPSFAPAYVTKAEAEVQLVELQKQTGNSSSQLADDAVRDPAALVRGRLAASPPMRRDR